jgi:hypothetical protein
MQKVDSDRRREDDKLARAKLYGTLAVKGGDIASKFQKDYIYKKYAGKDPMLFRLGGDKGFDVPMNLPRGQETQSSGVLESIRRTLYSKPSDFTTTDYTGSGSAIRPEGTAYTNTMPTSSSISAMFDSAPVASAGGVSGKIPPTVGTGRLTPEQLDEILKQYGNFTYSGGGSTASNLGGTMGNLTYSTTGGDAASTGSGLLGGVDASTVAGTTAGAADASTIANLAPHLGTILNAAMIPGQKDNEARVAQTAKTGGSLLATYILANLDKIGALFMSDRRLKENIDLVGQSGKGLNIYQWNYKGVPDKKYEGVMADEVPKEARVIFEGGLQAVDYSKIDVEMRRVY